MSLSPSRTRGVDDGGNDARAGRADVVPAPAGAAACPNPFIGSVGRVYIAHGYVVIGACS